MSTQPPDPRTIREAFREFHGKNPHVYDELVTLARGLVRAGHRRIGIGMLFEVLRWQRMLATTGDEFKLNNNYRSRYARLIMYREIDLRYVFETRRLHRL